MPCSSAKERPTAHRSVQRHSLTSGAVGRSLALISSCLYMSLLCMYVKLQSIN